MLQSRSIVQIAFAERDAVRFGADVAACGGSSASAELWAVERLVADACRLFELLGLIDDDLRRASRSGSLSSDDYARADAQIKALFSQWLASSRELEGMLRGVPGEDPIDGWGRFVDAVHEASWVLGDADRILKDPRMINLRDEAVDASRRGDVGTAFEDVRP